MIDGRSIFAKAVSSLEPPFLLAYAYLEQSMEKQVEVTVSAIIFNSKHEVLLCQSSKWNNQWVIPGGHVEYSEKLEDALKREVLEETGLSVRDISIASLQESIDSDSFHQPRHMLFIDYFCNTDEVDVQLNDEADRFEWVDLDRILSYDLGGFLPQLFDQIVNKKAQFTQPLLYGYAN